MKKIICLIITLVILLYAVSFGVATKLAMDTKSQEFLNADYDLPAEGTRTLTEYVERDVMSFEDAVNAMGDSDTMFLDMPHTSYMMFFDSAGNLLTESKCVLNIKIVKDEPFSEKKICVDLEKYMSDQIKADYVEKHYGVISVELYRENYTFTPVALNVMWFDGDESIEERIVLTDLQPNVHYNKIDYAYGDETITYEINDRYLYQEKDEIYNQLRSMAEGYRLSAATLDGKVWTGGGGRLDEVPFTEYSYHLDPVHFGNYTYFHYSVVAVNYLEAVFDESDFIKLIAAMTAVYLALGAATCGAVVYIFKREAE